jgi:hypothetical protein
VNTTTALSVPKQETSGSAEKLSAVQEELGTKWLVITGGTADEHGPFNSAALCGDLFQDTCPNSSTLRHTMPTGCVINVDVSHVVTPDHFMKPSECVSLSWEQYEPSSDQQITEFRGSQDAPPPKTGVEKYTHFH